MESIWIHVIESKQARLGENTVYIRGMAQARDNLGLIKITGR